MSCSTKSLKLVAGANSASRSVNVKYREPEEEPGDDMPPGSSVAKSLDAARQAVGKSSSRLVDIIDRLKILIGELSEWRDADEKNRELLMHFAGLYTEQSSSGNQKRTAPGVVNYAAIPRGGFGPKIFPIADRLIASADGPVSIEQIYEALPSEVHSQLEATSTVHSPLFRVRRMFRRNPRYKVGSSGVSIQDTDDGDIISLSVSRVLESADGGIAAFMVTYPDGKSARLEPRRIRELLRVGTKMVVETPGPRRSYLKISGGRLYTESDGIENDDFLQIARTLDDGEINVDLKLL